MWHVKCFCLALPHEYNIYIYTYTYFDSSLIFVTVVKTVLFMGPLQKHHFKLKSLFFSLPSGPKMNGWYKFI